MRATTLFATATVALVLAGRPLVKGARDWDSVDWEAADKSLEAGDEEEELRTEDSIAIAETERRKKMGIGMPEPGTKLKDPTEWVRHTQAMSGPTMMFVTLKNGTAPNGEPWVNQTEKQLGELTMRWRDMLKTDGIEATAYNIDEGRVLLSLQTGWRGYDVRDFLLTQPEVEELEWDSVKFAPGEDLPARPTDMKEKPGEDMMGTISRALAKEAKEKAKKAKKAAAGAGREAPVKAAESEL
jgi:hypothetical protein